jgi:GTP-binding protein HflX
LNRTISLEQLPEKAILVGFERRRGAASSAAAESFRELAELAVSAGAEIVAEVFQVRPIVEASTLIGHGKVQELKEMGEALQAGVLIVDHELTPTQQRNLENETGIRVIAADPRHFRPARAHLGRPSSG